MADDLVDGAVIECHYIIKKYTDEDRQENIRAKGFGKPSIVQRRRIRVALDGGRMRDRIEFVSSDPRTNSCCSSIENLAP